MKNSSLSKSFTRYAAIQAIYNLNFSTSSDDIKKYLIENNVFFIDTNLEVNFKQTKMSKVFFLKILDICDKEKDKIDHLINSNLSQGWDIKRLPKVQLAILRVAIAEMIINPKISVGVIISEYLMFTESFFSEKECSFTNAILEIIYNKLNTK